MPVDETGGYIGSWFDKNEDHLKTVSVTDIISELKSGASSQGQGGGEIRALLGEFVGLIGPIIAEYRAERMIREL